MSVSFSTLVEFVDGKPRTALSRNDREGGKTRAYTRPGDALSYRADILGNYPGRDIRIVTVTIPDLTPLGDTIWPNLVPQLAVSWS